MSGTGDIDDDAKTHKLQLFRDDANETWEHQQKVSGGLKHNVITGNAIDLGEAEKDREEGE